MEIVRTENLSKTYGSGENVVKAIDDVNLKIEKGEFIAIVGPSGSGKSTLLHLLGGVDNPSSGKIFIDGNDISKYTSKELALFRRRKVGLIYQFYNMKQKLSKKIFLLGLVIFVISYLLPVDVFEGFTSLRPAGLTSMFVCPIVGLIGLIFGIKEKDRLFILLNILLILLLPIAMLVGHLI
ncbi:ATP-binding cassette domain-containing protein [Peptoniphilus harei]|uniref:ATP-binding cassette domain-containing protein n=1 Tax=Peptoniphilus harei TaxID=54005 RepID=UPI00254D038A|nr:ATP-binding cassette domain-containing protein [Peptoniphilus harei]MDK7355768.1 ATP-binding cassette domain-containing protein [Peptoniphilus harei]MDK7371413.1 ATP-binding cassette domain-containing protein [Peptoniphilus harei]